MVIRTACVGGEVDDKMVPWAPKTNQKTVALAGPDASCGQGLSNPCRQFGLPTEQIHDDRHELLAIPRNGRLLAFQRLEESGIGPALIPRYVDGVFDTCFRHG